MENTADNGRSLEIAKEVMTLEIKVKGMKREEKERAKQAKLEINRVEDYREGLMSDFLCGQGHLFDAVTAPLSTQAPENQEG